MRKTILAVLLLLSACVATAQVTSLNETFNTSCAIQGRNYPENWMEYNTIPPLSLLGWTCAPGEGKGGTPCVKCSNSDGISYFEDTAWLITPQLNLLSYSGSIYLHFDTKYVLNASKIHISQTYNVIDTSHTPTDTSVHWTDLTAELMPVIGPADENGWVTHELNLTGLKYAPMYIAFKYTSAAAGGGTWYLDNVLTTETPMKVEDVAGNSTSLAILGNSTPTQTNIAYTSPGGSYTLSLYDMLGRSVCSQQLTLAAGHGTYTLNTPNLAAGIYLLKIGNEYTSNTIRVTIR